MNPKRFQPVRVLFIDHVVRMSGAEQSLIDLVVGLRASGPIEPIVVLPHDGPVAAQLRAHGVLVRMVPMSRRLLDTARADLRRNPVLALTRFGAYLAAAFRLWRLVREVSPHIVHTNTLKAHLLAIAPCAAARVPLVWHLRDILPKGWLLRALGACARFVSVVIVPSRAVAEPFKGNRRVYRKLRLVPNGIRVEEFQAANADRSLRASIGATNGDLVVGIVGRIAPWKGQETFLRAAAMLAPRYPRVRFAVIGAPLFEVDNAFANRLRSLVLQWGIEDRVAFTGWQPAAEAMAAIDVFVHASSEPEPFGRAIVEAMAAGKPVVAAQAGAVPEIVPPAAGILVPPGRAEELADALDRVLADRKIRKRMGEAGAAIADNFFPVQRTVHSVAQIYQHLASQMIRRTRRRRPLPKLPFPRRHPRPARPAAGPPAPLAQPPVRTEPTEGPWIEQAPFVPDVPPSDGSGTRRTVRIEDPPASPEWTPPRQSSTGRPNGESLTALPAGSGGAGRAAVLAAEMTIAPPLRLRTIAEPEPVVVAEPEPCPPAPAELPIDPAIFEPRPLYDALKRAMDASLALGILVLGAPLWLTIAVLIKLESRGPVIFRATAVGKDCKPYTYFKFRSMRIDGDDRAHRRFIEHYVRENGGHEHNGEVVYKFKGDDRVTAVGRWIRRFSLDEIPQIWNVLRGEMTFVGPRPPLDYEFEHYDDWAKLRLRVLPGITGMQQVWSRDQASFAKKMELDLIYIQRRSMWIDLKLIAHTILAIPRGH